MTPGCVKPLCYCPRLCGGWTWQGLAPQWLRWSASFLCKSAGGPCGRCWWEGEAGKAIMELQRKSKDSICSQIEYTQVQGWLCESFFGNENNFMNDNQSIPIIKQCSHFDNNPDSHSVTIILQSDCHTLTITLHSNCHTLTITRT